MPTADERILPHGTAFQTDVGMTGPLHSSLGAELEPFYKAMRLGEDAKYEVAKGPVVFNSTLIIIDDQFNSQKITRVQKIIA